MFARIARRYLECYFPKKLEQLEKDGKLEECLKRLNRRLTVRWNTEAIETMDRSGVNGNLLCKNYFEWERRKNEISNNVKARLIEESFKYSIELERASDEDDYNEGDWEEYAEGMLVLMEPYTEEELAAMNIDDE